MSKSKSKGSKAGPKPVADLLTKTKDTGVTKLSQTPKSKSADLAKKVIAKQEGLQKQKKMRKPDPESSDSSDSDDDSSEDLSDIEDFSKNVPKSTTKQNGLVRAKIAGSGDATDDSNVNSNGSSDGASDEGSDVESDLESPSSASSDEGAEMKLTVSKVATTDTTKALSESSDESDGKKAGDSSEDDKIAAEEESSDEEHEKTGLVRGSGTLKRPLPVTSASQDSPVADSDSDSDSDSSQVSTDAESDESVESDAESREEEVKAKSQPKRKADQETGPPEPKKSKIETDVAVATSPNLFVGQLSWNVDDEWLHREFAEFGELAGARVITDKQSGRSKGFGYVEYVKAADAAKALAAKNNAEIDGRKIRLDFSEPRRQSGNFQDRAHARAKSFGDQTSPVSDTLFVGNIAFNATQDAITEAFDEYGSITGVRLPTDRETGAPKGFGYVSFSTVEEATAALKGAQGLDVAGRPLRLDFSTPRASNGDSPFRGGRGGRGGNGGRGFGRGGFGGRGGRGGGRGGRGGSTNRGGFGDFSGQKTTF